MFSPTTTYRLTQATMLVNTAAGNHGGQALPERLDTAQLTTILGIPADDPSGTSAIAPSSALSDTADGSGHGRAAGADVEPGSEGALRSVRKLRSAVAGIWHDAAAQDPEAALSGINHLLAAVGPVHLSLPAIPDDGGSGTAAPDRHPGPGPASGSADRTPAVLAAGRAGDPMQTALTIDVALALTDVALAGELSRLRTCSGENCDNAFVDLTRNRSKQFCDEANCANRSHVRAYRARQAADADSGRDVVASGTGKKDKDKKESKGKKSKGKKHKKAKKAKK